LRIAIVGSGVSGLVCAHLLHADHDVTVFEADSRPGGHANTVTVDLDGESHQVDTGFIVYNQANYPGFTRLLDRLGVPTQPSDMSFSVSADDASFEYRGLGPNRLYAQRSNLLRPGFHRFLADILRFNRAARGLLDGGDREITLAQFVQDGGYSGRLSEHYLVPIGSAIWSADPGTFAAMPARTFAQFFHHHGLLGGFLKRPQWRTVVGGSARYVEAITGPLGDRLRLGTPVEKVVRTGRGVEIVSPTGLEGFDAVVLATHSDQALELLGDPTPAEREILGALPYQYNTATLHWDASVLPRRRRAWASWNYHLPEAPAGPGEPGVARVTYYMNRLQALESRHHICVTLNDDGRVDPDKVLARFDYDHPVLDGRAVAAQRRRGEIQGRSGTYFAGAYWNHGFHEDGVQSALDVGRHFGVGL